MEVGEAGEVVLPDEDVGVAQRRQVRQARLERDRDLSGEDLDIRFLLTVTCKL